MSTPEKSDSNHNLKRAVSSPLRGSDPQDASDMRHSDPQDGSSLSRWERDRPRSDLSSMTRLELLEALQFRRLDPPDGSLLSRCDLPDGSNVLMGQDPESEGHFRGMQILNKPWEQLQTVVLLLTRRVLFSAECLYAVYRAAVDDKLVVPVFLDRGGYDYSAAAEYLDHLEEELLHQPERLALLTRLMEPLAKARHDVSIADMQHRLRSVLQNLIAISWHPSLGSNHTAAVLSDIDERVSQWRREQAPPGQPCSVTSLFESWKRRPVVISRIQVRSPSNRSSIREKSLRKSLAESSSPRRSVSSVEFSLTSDVKTSESSEVVGD